MNIGVKGQEAQVDELLELLSPDLNISSLKSTEISNYDLIFDLDFDDNPEFIEEYAELEGKVIVVGAAKVQLEEVFALLGRKPDSLFVGMNTLPTFINRNILECTVYDEADKNQAQSVFAEIGLEAGFVDSRVGMVTPRIICMIINEAFFTVQEGTASMEDIDLGMKLGTAYPKGPFEWCEQIGIDNVYHLLEAMYEDTKDERYKICPLMKTTYLKSLS